jgi:hypothetical protein
VALTGARTCTTQRRDDRGRRRLLPARACNEIPQRDERIQSLELSDDEAASLVAFLRAL